MTTNLCSARKVNACAERGNKYWRFSTTSTCSLKRRRREEYQSFPRKSAKKRRNTQNARVQQKPSRTSKSYDRAKRKQKLLKRDENSRKRKTYRKSQTAKERGNFPTCQALNRLDRQCKIINTNSILNQLDLIVTKILFLLGLSNYGTSYRVI